MKRLIYRLIVGLITFTIGLCLSLIWNTSHDELDLGSQISPVQVQDLEPIVTICEIDSHPELYLGSRIRLRGWMYPENSQTLVESSLDCSGKGAKITIEIRRDEQSAYVSLLDKNPCTSLSTNVEVIGYLEPKVEKDNSQHHYHMTDARIVNAGSEYCF